MLICLPSKSFLFGRSSSSVGSGNFVTCQCWMGWTSGASRTGRIRRRVCKMKERCWWLWDFYDCQLCPYQAWRIAPRKIFLNDFVSCIRHFSKAPARCSDRIVEATRTACAAYLFMAIIQVVKRPKYVSFRPEVRFRYRNFGFTVTNKVEKKGSYSFQV